MCTNVIKKRHSTAQKCSTQDGLQDPYCLGMNLHFCLHVWQMTHATTIVIPTQGMVYQSVSRYDRIGKTMSTLQMCSMLAFIILFLSYFSFQQCMVMIQA